MLFNKKIQLNIFIVISLLCLWMVLYLHHTSWPQTYALVTAFTCLYFGFLVCVGLNHVYFLLFNHEKIAPRFMYYFGYNKNQSFTECWILKILLQIVVVVGSIYCCAQQFTFTHPVMNVLNRNVVHGLQFTDSTIYPLRIVCGIIVFCLLYLMCRRLSTQLSRKEAFEKEKEAQVAILSVLTYVGFALALLSGLWIAGFDFTGLTVVAGALSVGIGLGLQGIVNNFVSGLILLIEKPIKPGDRIFVDGIEGVVKKISVRSTQLITPLREDVMIPNSHFMTQPITNTMYTDKHVLIQCQINVPYGTDPQKVRELLLAVANNNSDVLKSAQHLPFVLFRAFEETALKFQLCCVIKDVNKKSHVQSDLNFAIESSFRQQNIPLVIAHHYKKIV